MNTAPLKSYAPVARQAFIAAVSAQAARLGITASGTQPAQVQGDVLLVGGQAFPLALADARRQLAKRVGAQGFDATMEAIAYTWFNRFAAIRYMELHGYLDHGYRVLSHPEGQPHPEILDHAADVDLPGLDRSRAIELKLDGTKDEELYRLLLKAQCNALHQAMPFLFEPIGGADELLLPANLLHTDSLIRHLVESIDEDLWQDIEIIGWLYQFYISEKKDEVMGSVVASGDIPAATQLFTPNWIVKYLVQNSLGAQWLATYPQSPLKGQMEYYIEPAVQTEEVGVQLAAITPSQLNPEELTLIDPACGSGHILVEAYELFKAIYLERGYRGRDVPQLILEKNLFGLDIDERGAQLTGFALMMKGRADDRRLFERGIKLNVMALQDSGGCEIEHLSEAVFLAKPEEGKREAASKNLADFGLSLADLTLLKRLCESATTFGSLIQIPEGLSRKLPALKRLSESTSQDLFVSRVLKRLSPLVLQTELLAAQYDAVVANPPYMGSGGMNGLVKNFVKDHFPAAKSDLFACFIERGSSLAKDGGFNAMVTMQSWMFLKSFQAMRQRLLREKTVVTMAHLGARAFASIPGEIVQTTAFALRMAPPGDYRPTFARLVEGDEADKREALVGGANRFASATQQEFSAIPGTPLAYSVTPNFRRAFSRGDALSDRSVIFEGAKTRDNQRFLRLWFEVCSGSSLWRPYSKGGEFRKWYGNESFVVRWDNQLWSFPKSSGCNFQHYMKPTITYGTIASSGFSARFLEDSIFGGGGAGITCLEGKELHFALAFLTSEVCSQILHVMSPTLNFEVGTVGQLPIPEAFPEFREEAIKRCIEIAKADWDSYERSRDFQVMPLLELRSDERSTIEASYTDWVGENRSATAELKRLEEENNRFFIEAYDLQSEMTSNVPDDRVSLTINPAYRYRGRRGIQTAKEQRDCFRKDTMEELVSYAIGCVMGRYSLDEPGLVFAFSTGESFEPSRYSAFPADEDGIVPVTDTEWFRDDACNRLLEFIAVAWPAAHLEENLSFLAASLRPRRSESSRETIRRWLNDSFFGNHHLRRYKSRPIYWLFTSGREKAFQCLVYLHRYNEGTLSRIRSEYVIPLQGKMRARIEQLEGDIQVATSTAHRKRLEKELTKIEKQQVELLSFDEKLRHYADRRITLDLDDGVKVNYGKFGDLLAEVRAVHGRNPETT